MRSPGGVGPIARSISHAGQTAVKEWKRGTLRGFPYPRDRMSVRMKNSKGPPRTPRVRSLGHGRKLRRSLSRGGIGPARALNTQLGDWDGVRITPMFGRWGYFVGER